MIVTQVYNPLAFACYQMGRPQIDILKCTQCLLHMYFRQFFLKSMYFSSCKIPENQKSVSYLQFYLILATQWLPVYKRFLLQHIFVHVIIHTYVVFDPRRTLFDYGEQIKVNVKIAAWTLHHFSTLKLNHPLLYDDDILTHAANDMKRTFLIVRSKILDERSWSYFDIELYTVSELKRYTHYT